MPPAMIDSTDAPDQVRTSLGRLLDQWLGTVRERTGGLPRQAHDAEWPSPCIVEGPDAKGDVCWCPIARTEPADFSGIEHALETRLHPDVISFYGSFYSDPLPMRAPDGGLTLLQAWSDRDFDRLLENLIGHALGQRRAGSPLSLFVAVTDEEDLNLCVHNELGIVLLERPSEPPLRQVAPSLAAFLGGLVPVVQVGGVGLLERSDRATP